MVVVTRVLLWGLVGLGKMGGNMRERIRRAGHEVVGYDRNKAVSDASSLADMVRQLDAPRVVWVMVPHGAPTRDTVAELAELLDKGDLVIDGGNSKFTEDFENEKLLKAKGIGYLDCGVSGGIWGLEWGIENRESTKPRALLLISPFPTPDSQFPFRKI